eukprot:1161712-Pelagomonas_calceolata.AAC.7
MKTFACTEQTNEHWVRRQGKIQRGCVLKAGSVHGIKDTVSVSSTCFLTELGAKFTGGTTRKYKNNERLGQELQRGNKE